MEEGMPFYEYRKDIVEFSELYQMSTTFHCTPDKILEWKEQDPHLYKCFRAFLSGMSKAHKGGDNGTINNRHNREFNKFKK
jgi:hypothetical protein